MRNIPMGEVLIEKKAITREQLEQALSYQKNSSTNQRIGEVLEDLGMITEIQKLEALKERLSLQLVDLKTLSVEREVVEKIPKQIALKYCAIAVKKQGQQLFVVIEDPVNLYAVEDIRLITHMQIVLLLAKKEDILWALDFYYAEVDARYAADRANEEADRNQEKHMETTGDSDDQTPIVRLLNTLLVKGYNTNITDIHIEPFENELSVRMRSDGMLLPYLSLSKNLHKPLLTRTKILAGLDIAEKRIPQDGHFQVTLEETKLNLRASIVPTIHGEKAVLRFLSSNVPIENSDTFGMNLLNYNKMLHLLNKNSGLIYITGPTGSGKTTTLYMLLKYLAEQPVNIATIEDPVEQNIDKVNQMQINYSIGLDFKLGLRALLRQDPDIIMIGETRDIETATISARASITGHLVLSTLHTRDAVSTFVRLRDMGVEQYLIGNSIKGIVAQRLVRKICNYCAYEYSASESECSILQVGSTKLRRGKGCQVCKETGYKGRVAVHEILEVDQKIRTMTANGELSDKIYGYIEEGHKMITLVETMKGLVLMGVTTAEELIRLAYTVE